MDKISQWIMAVVGVVMLSLTADIVLSEGRTKNYIKGVFALITLYVILSPLASLINGGINLDLGAFGSNMNPNGAYLDAVTKSQLSALKASAEKKLTEQGYGGAKVTINAYDQSITSVYVDISALSVPQSTYQSVCEKIKDIISKQLKIDRGTVVVYG